MSKDQLALSEAEAPATVKNGNGSILDLYQKTIDKFGSDQAESAVKVLAQLQSMHYEAVDRDAQRAFVAAMSAFQKACPDIPKVKRGQMKKQGTVQYTYDYADIETVGRIVKPILNGVGISYSFDTTITPIEGKDFLLTATCTFRHIDGHSESSRFSCPTESVSGASPQQKAGIAETYAKRRALISGLGLTQCERDTDGAPADGNGDTNKITDDQVTSLQSLIEEVGADEKRFVKLFDDAERIEDITRGQFAKAISLLEQKRRQK